ncbi:hypothetical protein Voc01_028080 [Virgisporangium ochraceum]|uniref:Uncharacterized protein n=1 Tax=Virgisporangium ochraceum TaxID=65505 RepID=A0A8J3ZQG0_9ACTN|nr:hypothetical protein Voc01_028080 [Virgisporangium ochraceum]
MFSLGQPLGVTAAEVIRAADAADEAAADIRTKSQSLVNSMISRSAQFQGGAGNAFRKVLVEFVDDLNVQVLQKLEDLSNKTRTSANELFSRDDINAAELTAKGNNFGGSGPGGLADSGQSGHVKGGGVTASLES